MNSAMPGMAAPMAGSSAAIPSYAVANPEQQKTETLSVIALVVSILSLPAALYPLGGIVLAIAGLVMGTIARSHAKRVVNLIAIILSVVGILLSIAAFVYVATVYNKTHGSNATGSHSTNSGANASSRAVSTPCYKLSLPQLTTYDYNGTSCDFQSYNASTAAASSEAYAVFSSKQTSVNDGNFSAAAKAGAEEALKQQGSDVKLISESDTTFAGSKAYAVNATVGGASRGSVQMVVIYHPTNHGENLFVALHALNSGTPDVQSLSKAWEWQP